MASQQSGSHPSKSPPVESAKVHNEVESGGSNRPSAGMEADVELRTKKSYTSQLHTALNALPQHRTSRMASPTGHQAIAKSAKRNRDNAKGQTASQHSVLEMPHGGGKGLVCVCVCVSVCVCVCV